MSILSLVLPVIGQPDSTEDPKLNTALSTIQAWANGNIDGTNNLTSGAALANLGDSGWIVGGNGVSYRRVGPIVVLRGVSTAASNATIFTLPSGFTPATDSFFTTQTTVSVNALCYVYIVTGGVIYASFASGGNPSLDNMFFLVD